jgi:hypothetical protein
MKNIVYILLILMAFSCSRKFSITNIFSKGIPANMQQWVLDSSYNLYIREVFLDTSEAGDKKVLTVASAGNKEKKIIEIEYLLLSEKSDRAVYIATVPDKYQNYYAKKAQYLKREYLNAYDFSTFRFGTVNSKAGQIIYNNKQKQQTDTWLYKKENDSVLHIFQVIERLNEDATNVYLVDEAISYPAVFIKLPAFKIAFRNMDKERKTEIKKGRPPLERFSSDNTIYYSMNGNRANIYFRFNKTLPPRYQDSAIQFGNTRLVNLPFK